MDLVAEMSRNTPRVILTVSVASTPVLDVQGRHTGEEEFLLAGGACWTSWSARKTTKSVYTLRTVEDFWRLIFDSVLLEATLTVVSPNAARDFRLLELFGRIDSGELSLTRPGDDQEIPEKEITCALDDPPFLLRSYHRDGKRAIVWCDLANWWRAPLSAVAEASGVTLCSQLRAVEPEHVIERSVRREAVATLTGWHFAERTRVRLGAPYLGSTIASTAWAAFKMRDESDLVCPHRHPAVTGLERDSYFPGRSEVFRAGEYRGKCYQVDVCAQYPGVMGLSSLPYQIASTDLDYSGSTFPSGFRPENSIAKVLVDCPEPRYPDRRQGAIVYERGAFWTALAGPELARAVAEGLVRRVGAWATYDCLILFASWLQEWWQLRTEASSVGDHGTSRLLKLAMNSIYGKFAEKRPGWHSVVYGDPHRRWGRWERQDVTRGTVTAYRAIAGTVQERVEGEYAPHAFLPVPAFVTSYSRIQMDYLRLLAGLENVLYQGVDSLIVTSDGYARLWPSDARWGDSPGKLRLVAEGDSCDIVAPGVYRIGRKIVQGGLKEGSVYLGDGEWLVRGMRRPEAYLDDPCGRTVVVTEVRHHGFAAINP